MKTKQNENICSNCGTNNPFYKKNCTNCKHYLRATVVNIDLWKTIWLLFENPSKAFTDIIFAEHKNFLVPLLTLLSIKIYLTAFIIQSVLLSLSKTTNYLIYNTLILCGIYIVSIVLFSFFFTKITNKTRFKDNVSLITYSFIPIIFSLIILTPIEYGIFGEYWFTHNPSPLLIKISIQTSSRIFSIIIAVIFMGTILSEIFFIPHLLF